MQHIADSLKIKQAFNYTSKNARSFAFVFFLPFSKVMVMDLCACAAPDADPVHRLSSKLLL